MQPEEYIKKYQYRINWSEQDNTYIAYSLELPSILAHGNTQEKALSSVKEAILITLQWMREENEMIPEPLALQNYSGRFSLRVGKEKHQELAIKAAENGLSLNQYILSRL